MFILGFVCGFGLIRSYFYLYLLSQSYLKTIIIVVIKLNMKSLQFFFIDKTIQAFFKVSKLNIV